MYAQKFKVFGTYYAGVIFNSFSIPDHGMISVDDLAIGGSLHCVTVGDCCSIFSYLPLDAQLGRSPSGIGSWRYPNGSYVRLALASDSYGISRQPGQVNLHRLNSGMAEGLWRCEVPGRNVGETIHIGFYTAGGGIYRHASIK